MEIIASQDGTILKVVKTLKEEIEQCTNPELKEKLESFQKEFEMVKLQQKAFDELLMPALAKLGDRLKEFNNPVQPPPLPSHTKP